ncbi:MAG: hypothetical protein AAGA93_04110 [Actinomycetota bacterium]
MRILIVGLPKSGTTILTYRVAAALDGAVVEFEPLGGPDAELAAGAEHVVTKKLLGTQTHDLADFGHYDRRIWICRDPRDFLVSQTLYRWHRETEPDPSDQQAFDRVVERLVAKEADPASVPFADLEPADYANTYEAVARLWVRERGPGWHLYRYEDMVAGRYADLEAYLGFAVDHEATVADGLERVVRARSAGDWRHWFTEGDVDHYRRAGLDGYMATFGYDLDDWSLAPEPVIDPAHGSGYVTGLFNDHRLPGDGVDGADENGADGAQSGGALDADGRATPVAKRLLGRLRGAGLIRSA